MPEKRPLPDRFFRLNLYYEAIKTNSWLVLGGTSPWPTVSPVAPSDHLYRVPEAFALVYFHRIERVYNSASGELSYGDDRYRVYRGEPFGTPTALYLEAFIPNDLLDRFGFISYRIYGLYHSVVFSGITPSREKGEIIDPSYLDDFKLGWVATFDPIQLTNNYQQTVKLLLSF